MLEARDFDKIESLSPSTGSIDVRLCGIFERLTSLSFVRYVEVLQLLSRYGRRSGWSLEELQTLRRVIKEF